MRQPNPYDRIVRLARLMYVCSWALLIVACANAALWLYPMIARLL